MSSYYKFDIGNLPDELFHPDVPVDKWLERTTTADTAGFPKCSLNVLSDHIPLDVELERIVGVSLYMVGNILPFLLPPLLVSSIFFSWARMASGLLVAYSGVLWTLHILFRWWFLQKYQIPGKEPTGFLTGTVRENHFIFTERHSTKYLQMNFVWPKSMQRPAMQDTPLIFCVVPHGVAPLGAAAYPLWDRLWNDKTCHWTAAPAVLKLPIVGDFMRKLGCIPAKARNIHETLTKKEENVGIILDGIAGMFQTHHNEETAYLKSRKGVIKIALRAGATIVPVYGFGHTSLYTVMVDPFGILEKLSNWSGVSLTPFFGRFSWFLGPPRKIPVTVCLGEPVRCPLMEDPAQDQVDAYHTKMLDSFQELFDKHKHAYGWPDRQLKFV